MENIHHPMISPMANAPMHVAPAYANAPAVAMAYANAPAPVAGAYHHCGCAYPRSSAAYVLVLFILLVIILRSYYVK